MITEGELIKAPGGMLRTPTDRHNETHVMTHRLHVYMGEKHSCRRHANSHRNLRANDTYLMGQWRHTKAIHTVFWVLSFRAENTPEQIRLKRHFLQKLNASGNTSL